MRFAPDGVNTEPGILRRLNNFAPNNNGAYGRVPAAVLATPNALGTNSVMGAGIVKNLAGTSKLYAGTITKVYQADGSAGWTDRSGGVTFAATTWVFAQFGTFTIAANGASKLQVATTGNFADITNAPTGPITVFSHANGLVALGNSTDGAAWARCKSGDHTTWTAAANNDAGSGTLYGGIGGPLIAGCAWENLAIAWKSRAMYAATYVGNADPNQPVLRWQTIASDVGCVSPFGYIQTEKGLLFVSERGIMLFNGSKPFNIDDDIRKTFMAEAMGNRSKIFCTMDEGRNHVYIWFSPTGSTWCSAAYIWNYKTGMWGRLDEIADMTGTTISDPRVGVRDANHTDIVSIGGLGTNSTETANLFFDATAEKLVNLSGASFSGAAPPGDATIQTGLLSLPGMDSTIRGVIPVTDEYRALSTAVTLQVATYDETVNPQTVLTAVPLSSKGRWDVMRTAPFFDLLITAGDTANPSYQNFVIEFSRQGSDKIERMTI